MTESKLSSNVRDGPWLGEYIVRRLRHNAHTESLGLLLLILFFRLSSTAHWLDAAFKELDGLPRGVKPAYFIRIVSTVYSSLTRVVNESMHRVLEINTSHF
jgi:hypothetical protein